MAACRIQVYTDQVHAILYCLIERFFQFCLVYIVLVLTYTDGFRIYLHPILPTGPSGGGRWRLLPAPLRHNRETRRGNLRSRINGSSLLTDYKHGYLTVEALAVDEIFCLTLAVPLPMEMASI